MKDGLKEPEILPSDFSKWESPYQQHVYWLALSEFRKANNR